MKRLIAAALLALLPFTAQAANISMCGPVEAVRDRLAKDYGEIPIAGWPYTVDGANQVRLLYGNPETGTFTMVAAEPYGYACTMYDGEGLGLGPKIKEALQGRDA